MINPGKYGKTITAVCTGLIGWAALVVNSAPTAITASEWIAGATSLAIAIGVFSVTNA
jgi:hypothetical protein